MLIDRGRHQRHSASRQADRTGGILATFDFNMFKIGCTATRAAARYLKREPLPDKVMLPAEIINKTNYKAWLFPWISGVPGVERGGEVEYLDVVPSKAGKTPE